MLRSTGGAGSQAGVTVTAISGVEIALWDLAGKILGVPVCKLLGGQYRDGVRAYWTTGPKDMLDPASCREFAAGSRATLSASRPSSRMRIPFPESMTRRTANPVTIL